MAASIPTQIAETVQTAHVQRAPSPHHDLNPSTAASEKHPVHVHGSAAAHPSSRHEQRRRKTSKHYDNDDSIDDYDDDDEDIPISVLRPRSRGDAKHGHGHHFPPMPDLRFEQSYLHSIEGADRWWKVVWVTVRDQMMMPFAQGILYNLAICGWQHWNKNAQMSGSSAGARLRRWWYGVNNWPLPEKAKAKAKSA